MTDKPPPQRSSIDNIGMVVAEARHKLGWSQSYLGMVTGYCQTTISAIERNCCNPNAGTLQDISNALGVRFVIEPD